VIRTSDIDGILNRRDRDLESLEDWCQRHDVDFSVMRQLAGIYAFNDHAAASAIDAFRLSHEARRGDEPRAKPSLVQDGRRYAVESVVVDRRTGRIVGDPTPVQDEAEGLAGSYNEIDAEPSQADRSDPF
jgi:hypothetical protein